MTTPPVVGASGCARKPMRPDCLMSWDLGDTITPLAFWVFDRWRYSAATDFPSAALTAGMTFSRVELCSQRGMDVSHDFLRHQLHGLAAKLRIGPVLAAVQERSEISNLFV